MSPRLTTLAAAQAAQALLTALEHEVDYRVQDGRYEAHAVWEARRAKLRAAADAYLDYLAAHAPAPRRRRP